MYYARYVFAVLWRWRPTRPLPLALGVVTPLQLFLRTRLFPDAIRIAMRESNLDKLRQVFAACDDEGVKKQMGMMLGRHGVTLDLDDDAVNALIGNETLTTAFAGLARELDVVEAKSPEDIYKTHLSQTGSTRRDESAAAVRLLTRLLLLLLLAARLACHANICWVVVLLLLLQAESARGNLASTFVNAFVNAGYTTDKLITPADSQWLWRNKGNAVMSVAASLGMILQWNSTELSQLDKFLESADPVTKGGGLFGIGLCCAKVRNEVDAAFAVLSEYLDESVAHPKVRAPLYLRCCCSDVGL